MGVMKRIAGGAKPHPLLIDAGERAYPIHGVCGGKGCDDCLYTGYAKLGPKALEIALAEYETRKARYGPKGDEIATTTTTPSLGGPTTPPTYRPEPDPTPASPTGQLSFGW